MHVHRFLLRLWLEFSLKVNDREETFYRICDRHNRNYSDQPERAEKPEFKPAGDFLAFLAMISWGLYSATVKKIEEWNYPTAAVTRRIYFYGIIFLIPVLILQHAMWDMDALKRPEVISNFLFLGVGASAVGFFLWNLSTKWIGVVKTSVYIYVSPVVTVVLSMFVLMRK